MHRLIHILLSVVTMGILIVAACQAVLLATQDHLLRQKKNNFFLQFFPSIQTMENRLFLAIRLGFVVLTLTLIISLYFFRTELFVLPGLLQKTLLALLAWFVFIVLLLGRHYGGWRGKTAIRWTLGGVLVLCLSYVLTLWH